MNTLVHDAREKWNRPAVGALPPWLGELVPLQSLPGIPSVGPSCCACIFIPTAGWRKSCLLTGCRKGGCWCAGTFSYPGWSPPYRVRRNMPLQLKNLYQPFSCPSSTCGCTVVCYIQVCYRLKQTTSGKMNQVHSLAELREAGGVLYPWTSREASYVAIRWLWMWVDVNMLGLSFPPVLVLLLNTVSLHLWVNFCAYPHNRD